MPKIFISLDMVAVWITTLLLSLEIVIKFIKVSGQSDTYVGLIIKFWTKRSNTIFESQIRKWSNVIVINSN